MYSGIQCYQLMFCYKKKQLCAGHCGRGTSKKMLKRFIALKGVTLFTLHIYCIHLQPLVTFMSHVIYGCGKDCSFDKYSNMSFFVCINLCTLAL